MAAERDVPFENGTVGHKRFQAITKRLGGRLYERCSTPFTLRSREKIQGSRAVHRDLAYLHFKRRESLKRLVDFEERDGTEHQLHRTIEVSVVDRDRGWILRRIMGVEGPHRLGLRSVVDRIERKLDYARGTGRRTGTGYDVFSQDSEASSMG